MKLFREVEEAEPGAYRPHLADAFGRLGRSLSNLGRDQEALPHATEAVKLFRAVEEAEPGSHRAYLASALDGLADP